MRCTRFPRQGFPLGHGHLSLVTGCALFILFAPLGTSREVRADPPGQVVESQIDRVTVYAKTAHIARSARVELATGIHTLVFDKLPLATHTDALGCGIEGEGRVLGIRIERRTYAEPVEERVRMLERELARLDREIEDLGADLRVLDQKQEFLTGVRVETPKAIAEVASSAQGVNPVTHLRGALGFVTTEWTTLERQRLAVRRKQDELIRRRTRVNGEIQELRTPSPALERLEAHVEVEALAAGPVRLELSYLVGGASWRPYYDARLDRATGEVAWSSYAEIHQSSGEDWDGVELALSTADPLRSTAAPELQPIYLAAGMAPPQPDGMETALTSTTQKDVEAHALKEKEVVVGWTNPAQRGRADPQHKVSAETLRQSPSDNVNEAIALKAGAVSQGGELHFRGGRGGEVDYSVDGVISGGPEAPGHAKPGVVSLADLSRTATATLYRITRRESIPADGSWHRVTVATHRLPVTLEFVAVPRKARFAFLRASGANATGAPLLPGPVHLFSASDYLGTGSLPSPVAPGAPLTLSFGSLDRLEVQHELISEERTRSRGDSRLRYHYRIRIANFDDATRRVIVLDQVPVPVDTRIEVQIERVAPQPVEANGDPRGVMRWEAEVAPGASQAIDLEYEVRFPKEWQVAGL